MSSAYNMRSVDRLVSHSTRVPNLMVILRTDTNILKGDVAMCRYDPFGCTDLSRFLTLGV